VNYFQTILLKLGAAVFSILETDYSTDRMRQLQEYHLASRPVMNFTSMVNSLNKLFLKDENI
jgi:hypothetical protein